MAEQIVRPLADHRNRHLPGLPDDCFAVDDPRCHLLNERGNGIHTMEDAYSFHSFCPTSTNGDVYLIRSHIAYHCGLRAASECTIKPSRGHSYRVRCLHGADYLVRISDHYDHRHGVVGII